MRIQKPSTQPASRSSSRTVARRRSRSTRTANQSQPPSIATDGADELVGLLVAEPDAGAVRAVDVLGVVAGRGAERAHVRLHLLARGLLLRVLAAADGEERERRQRGGATPSRQPARRRTASAGASSAAGSSATASALGAPRPAPRRRLAASSRLGLRRLAAAASASARPRRGSPPPAWPRLGLRGRHLGGRLAQLADARLLADLLAQVVELRAVDVADRADLDLLDLRRVHRERPLDADAERLLADGERLARAGALALDHDPLEDLHAAALALDHLEVHAHGVARLEARQVLAQLALLDALDDRAHGKGRPRGRRPMVAKCSADARCGSAASRSRRPCRSGSSRGTVPHSRESHDCERLSPIMKYCPCGTWKVSRPPRVAARSGRCTARRASCR